MSRLDAITGAFLRYLYRSDQFRPEVSGFLAGPHADEIDPPVTVDELSRALTWLRSCELVAATGTPVEDLPVRAGLTGAGLICAGPYHGDVRAWHAERSPSKVLVEEREGGGRRDDAAGEVVRPREAPESTSAAEPNVSLPDLARVARVLLLTLPSLDDGHTDDQRVRRLAQSLLSEARRPDPDTPRARQLARMLRAELHSGPVAGTLGVVLLDGLDDALGDRDRS